MSLIDTVLEHHGIKGMKWGIRRRSGGTSSRGKAPTSEDFKKAQAAKAKVTKGKTHALSNEELQSLVKRMNLEKQFKDLNAKQGSENKAKQLSLVGGKVAGEIIANVGKQQASRLLNEAVTNATKKAAKK